MVCSQMALAAQNAATQSPAMWTVPSPSMGIPILKYLQFDIDTDKKKITFFQGIEPLGGPFTVEVGEASFLIRSVKYPDLTYAIDRRTGAYIMRDLSTKITEVGICATTNSKAK